MLPVARELFGRVPGVTSALAGVTTNRAAISPVQGRTRQCPATEGHPASSWTGQPLPLAVRRGIRSGVRGHGPGGLHYRGEVPGRRSLLAALHGNSLCA